MSGNAKYVIAGLLLLAGAAGLWMLVQPTPPPPAPPPPAVAAAPARSTALVADDLVLDAPEPEPEAAAVEPVKRRKRGTPVGDWDCSGELPMPAITKVMRENQSQIRNCYERRLKANNILQGDLSLKVKVGATGSVVASGVSGTLRDSEVFSCVRSIADKWRFPAPAGGNCAVVQVPFRFSPKN